MTDRRTTAHEFHRASCIVALVLVSSLVGGVGGPGGCASAPRSSPYSPLSEGSRDTIKAQQLTQQAAGLIVTDPDKAEKLLREALTADLTFGPAHNDLGVLELNRGHLYEAASEFEWARKLIPGHPDPRMNLALTLEKAGRNEEALATYNTALEVYPGHMPTMQALARLQVRTNRTDDRTSGYMSEIALAGETPEWRHWAQSRLAITAGTGTAIKPIRDAPSTAPLPLPSHP